MKLSEVERDYLALDVDTVASFPALAHVASLAASHDVVSRRIQALISGRNEVVDYDDLMGHNVAQLQAIRTELIRRGVDVGA